MRRREFTSDWEAAHKELSLVAAASCTELVLRIQSRAFASRRASTLTVAVLRAVTASPAWPHMQRVVSRHVAAAVTMLLHALHVRECGCDSHEAVMSSIASPSCVKTCCASRRALDQAASHLLHTTCWQFCASGFFLVSLAIVWLAADTSTSETASATQWSDRQGLGASHKHVTASMPSGLERIWMSRAPPST